MQDTDNTNTTEKREHPRFHVQYLTQVYYHNEELGAAVIDISEGGAGLLLSKKIPEGEELTLKIKCGPSKNIIKEIEVKTKVIWAEEKNEEDFFRTGLQITDISPEDFTALQKNIQELAGKQNKIAGLDITDKTILIIEDLQALRYILSFDLHKKGLKTIPAENGEEGIELAKTNLPDLIILDVMLPGIDGFETCRRLKKEEATKDIPVIIVSVRSQAKDIMTGLAAGAVAYVVKNQGFDKIYDKIVEVIGE